MAIMQKMLQLQRQELTSICLSVHDTTGACQQFGLAGKKICHALEADGVKHVPAELLGDWVPRLLPQHTLKVILQFPRSAILHCTAPEYL